MNKHNNSVIYPNIELHKSIVIEDFCIIGSHFDGYNNEKTFIGKGAIIRAGTIIYAGNTIGDNFHSGNKANIRENNLIGDNVSIGTLSVIEHSIIIGNGVRIHSQAFIPEFTVLGDNCWIGPNVVITNAKYPKHPDAKENLMGVNVGENCKIGANSTILPGVKIGENTLVGAGSVVVKDLPSNVIAVGNPIRILRKIDY